ncbi:hypothetical protein TZ87_00758 [Streptococcus oralis subsp. oralis]|uniref:Immunity protein n=2 Tax=Streptococcus oralis TaxID=1303 RepID=A0A0F2D1U6_STROR|nr:hypothetical protein TZ87_00758 [Streptococcus oralis subsp. oralis]
MKKKIFIILTLYLIMSIFLYPLRESIWYLLFYTIAYMIAVMIYFALTKKKGAKKMKIFLAKKRNIFLTRLFLGQFPLLVSTYLFLSRQFLNFSLVSQFLLVVINLASILVTVYLTREMRIREFEDDDLVSPRTNQLMFIGLTSFMSIICLYRGITAEEFYQQLILYICAILCLLIMLLLIWGLKYYKK